MDDLNLVEPAAPRLPFYEGRFWRAFFLFTPLAISCVALIVALYGASSAAQQAAAATQQATAAREEATAVAKQAATALEELTFEEQTANKDDDLMHKKDWAELCVYSAFEPPYSNPDVVTDGLPFADVKTKYLQAAQQVKAVKLAGDDLSDDAIHRALLDLMRDHLCDRPGFSDTGGDAIMVPPGGPNDERDDVRCVGQAAAVF